MRAVAPAVLALSLAACARPLIVEAPGTGADDAPTPAPEQDPELRLIEQFEENKLNAVLPRKPRSPASSKAFRVEELPELKLPAQANIYGFAGPFGAGSSSADELTIESADAPARSAKPSPGIAQRMLVRAKGKVVGKLSIGNSEGSAAAGVTVNCGGPAHPRPTSMSWETLEAEPGSTSLDKVRYSVVVGWFDYKECKAVVTERMSAALPALANGQLYGFRLPSKSPGETSDTMVVVGPRMSRVSVSSLGAQITFGNVGYLRAVVPLRRGGGGSIVTQLTPGEARAWLTAVGVPSPLRSTWLAGMDIAESVGDEGPVAVAYERKNE